MWTCEIQNETVVNVKQAEEGWRGMGWGLLVVGMSDGVAGRTNLLKKVSVVFSDSKFELPVKEFLDPPLTV